jgi:hypothetical protein
MIGKILKCCLFYKNSFPLLFYFPISFSGVSFLLSSSSFLPSVPFCQFVLSFILFLFLFPFFFLPSSPTLFLTIQQVGIDGWSVVVAPTRQPKAAQARSSATPSQARDACWRQVLLRRVAGPKKKKEKKEKEKKRKKKKKKKEKKEKEKKKKERNKERNSGFEAQLPQSSLARWHP